jgi:hypothetical protein
MEHILGGTDLRAEGGTGATKTQAEMTRRKNKVSRLYVAGSIRWWGCVACIVIVAHNVNHRGGHVSQQHRVWEGQRLAEEPGW